MAAALKRKRLSITTIKRRAFNLETALEAPNAVEALYLYNRNLKELPPEVFLLKNLKILDLSKNKFTQIPAQLIELPQLERLNLDFNQLTHIDFDFSQLPHLRSIQISNNSIPSFSSKIFFAKNLEEINAHSCDLKKLPKDLGKLSNLKKLELTNNKLKELPGSIGELRNLEYLAVTKNQITQFPQSLAKLKQLKKIYFECSPNVDLTQFKLLEELYFRIEGQNKRVLKFGPLPNLKLLTIIGDGNHPIPDDIFENASLRKLHLTNFNNESLPPKIGQLSKLEELTISKTSLKVLPKEFVTLKRLRDLSIPNANFEKIPESLLNLIDLQRLRLKFKGHHYTQRILRFIKQANKQMLPFSLRKTALQVADGNEELLATLSRASILLLLEFQFQHLEAIVKKYIIENHSLSLKKYPFKKGIHLFIVGKTDLNLAKKQDLLKELKITISPELNDKTTHVILGRSIKLISKVVTRDLVFTDERRFNRWLQEQEQPFLLMSSDKEIESLSKLLLSFQSNNIEIALQLLDSGGVPTKILTDLVIVFKKLPEGKQKRAIRKILALNLSENALKIVSLKTGIRKKEVLISTILELAEGTEIDGQKNH